MSLAALSYLSNGFTRFITSISAEAENQHAAVGVREAGKSL